MATSNPAKYSLNSNAFVTMFGDEVSHLSQQKASKLQGAIRIVRGVQGHSYNFPVLGKSGVIKNKGATTDLEPMSGMSNTAAVNGTWQGTANADLMAHTNVTATLNTYSTGEYIDDFDALKTNIDLRSAYADSISAAMNRAYDSEIIAALDDAKTNETLAAEITDGNLDKANVIALSKALTENDVPLTDRFLIISPSALNSMMGDANIVSSDFGVISNQALTDGFIPNLFGFNVIVSNLLTTVDTDNKQCFAFHKNAVGCAVGKDITTMVNYVPHKLSTLIAAEFSAGCKVIDPKGVASISAA